MNPDIMGFEETVHAAKGIGLNPKQSNWRKTQIQKKLQYFVDFSTEDIASSFLEISSEQRLNILFNLKKKETNISSMAKVLDATVPEVHRNFTRLVKAGLIAKNNDLSYRLTEYGKVVSLQVPTIAVSPEIKTETPKLSSAVRSEAVSFAV